MPAVSVVSSTFVASLAAASLGGFIGLMISLPSLRAAPLRLWLPAVVAGYAVLAVLLAWLAVVWLRPPDAELALLAGGIAGIGCAGFIRGLIAPPGARTKELERRQPAR